MRIVFCLPGNKFSGHFLKSWTSILSFCNQNKIEAVLSQQYDSNVYYVRSKCLGANVLRGKYQKPFDGKLDYDYIMWIDSDIIYKPEHLIKLLNHNKDIVCGLYKMEGGKQFAVVQDWNEDFFRQHGSFKFLDDNDIAGKTELMEVDYSGFGFMLIKRSVFENIEYPWFEPQFYEFGNNVKDFCSEDVGFCKKARAAGFKIHIDPTVIVGHEKIKIY